MKENSSAEYDLNRYKSKHKKKPKVSKSKKERIFRTVLAVFMIGVIAVCMAMGGFMLYCIKFIDGDMGINLEDYKKNSTTTIYVKDESGEGWVEYQRLHGSVNRIWVGYEEMPENLRNAFVAIEDKRFNTHGGVDWRRTIKAFANYYLHFLDSNPGGSTITQQLVKNLTGDKEQSKERKIREIMRARYLEIHYSKETILECYLNVVSMANNISGVEVAANYYFDKHVSDLTLSECAVLAGITQNPEYYRPDTHLDNNLKRRNLVLSQMLEQGYITKEEYEQAKAEEVHIVANAESIKKVEINTYFVDALIDQVTSDLQKLNNCSAEDASMLFYNGGYQVYSSMNPSIQGQVDEVFNNSAKYGLKASNGAVMQGAITVMDYSGHIVGMSGGIGEKETNRGWNRATMAVRQPGSTMKPIAAYCPAIENNLITYSSILTDEPHNYGNWKPVNWYKSYWGNITAHYALERSVNTIPVYLVNELSPQKSFDFLTQSLGITTLNQPDASSLGALGMGGTNGGLTTTESAAAFAIFGNLGKYYSPSTYYYVTDSHDNIVLQYSDEGSQVIGEDTATVMNYMLRNVVYGANGTGGGAAGYIKGMKIYAKTGTSDSTRDLWFVGGSPYYVASCWCGYDNNETINSGVIAQRMWGAVMTPIHKDLEPLTFTDSQYASSRYYCTQTGLLATPNCPSRAVGYYKNSYLPTCSMHGGKILKPITGTDETPTGVSGVVSGTVGNTAAAPEPQEEESSEESSSSEEASSSTSSSVIGRPESSSRDSSTTDGE